MKKHVFVNNCINFEEILAYPNLGKMLRIAHKQSKDEQAKLRVDFANYKDYGADEWCPAYFGQFVEWLAGHYLNEYGVLFNIDNVQMNDSEENFVDDYGIDGVGVSLKDQHLKGTNRKAKAGSPVYVQVKGTLNTRKLYQANDGSRLPNFGMNAMGAAIVGGHAYQARYVVFTTGAGLYYTLDKMSNGLLEVISYKKINALVTGNTGFLNRLRAEVGLPALPVSSEIDPEAALIRAELNEDEESLIENA